MSQKYIDGFVPFHLPKSSAPMTLFIPAELMDEYKISPADWLEAHYGDAVLSHAMENLRYHDYSRRKMDLDPEACGRDFGIMRVRIYETGDMAFYGLAGKDQAANISADETPQGILKVEDIYSAHIARMPVDPPEFGNGPHSCSIDITVMDIDSFEEDFCVDTKDPAFDLSATLRENLFLAFSTDDFGARLTSVEAEMVEGKMIARLDVDISDARLFNQRISLIGRRSGFDDDWTPGDAGEAIFEAFCGCNDTPSPDWFGLQFDAWEEIKPEIEEGPTP